MKALNFTVGKSEEVIKTENIEAISRHEASIQTKVQVSHTFKDEIIELKFASEQSQDEVQQWVADIKGALSASDKALGHLRQVKEEISKQKQAVELAETMKQELAVENEEHQLKMHQESELYEQQLKFQKVLFKESKRRD